MSNFFDWNEIEFKQKREAVFYKTICGENMQMFVIKLQPGEETNHSHPEEQMGYILSGEVEITIGNEKKKCKIGEVYYIPANIQHGFKVVGDNDLEYIEIFSPPKEEHKNL